MILEKKFMRGIDEFFKLFKFINFISFFKIIINRDKIFNCEKFL